MSISGVMLPENRNLDLLRGLVTPNLVAEKHKGSSTEEWANVVPDGQTEPTLKRIARWILAFQFEAQNPTIDQVRGFAEKIVLPLRLGSPATIMLDAIKMQKGALEQIIALGIEQAAAKPNREFSYVTLNENWCQAFERHPAQLFYNAKYDLALSHYSRSHYQISSAESAMLILLSLETLFDQKGSATGQAERVAERVSCFAATSIKQKRDMRKDVVRAYKHRGTLRHGETNPEKIQAAKEWFGKNLVSLQIISAWAIQRVLSLASEDPGFDLMSFAREVGQGNTSALKRVMSLPLFWVTDGQQILPLPLEMFTIGGLDSIEIIKHD